MIAARSGINIVSLYKMNNVTACYFDTDRYVPVDGEYVIIKERQRENCYSNVFEKEKGDEIVYTMENLHSVRVQSILRIEGKLEYSGTNAGK